MRRAARVDDNQSEIVAELRKLGASVRSTAVIGNGFPDLAVGFRGRNFLLECKDGQKSASRRRLSDDEKEFHAGWLGQVAVVETVEEAIAVVMGLT